MQPYTNRQLFLAHQAQTTDFPLGLEIVEAEGVWMTDVNGKKYLDLISGISVSNLGHRHPRVVDAIKRQLDSYMHLMVYGEYIQSPQVKLARALHQNLHPSLDSVYFVNSGSEAIEGAMKLAKRYTGKSEIVSCINSYHGSTQGALSVIGDEEFRQAYRPLLPGIRPIPFNDLEALEKNINSRTAAVLLEVVQGEAGYIPADIAFLEKARSLCNTFGALLIFDEVQTGFGRTGALFGFHHSGIVPDIITLAKGMGGGLPIGAFIAPKNIMDSLKQNPILGHITTFGGNSVCCAASLAVLQELLESKLVCDVPKKEALFRELLQHPNIIAIQGKGLMLRVELRDFEYVQQVIAHCVEKGLVTDWFLFNTHSLRIAPPLIITEEEIRFACGVIVEALSKN